MAKFCAHERHGGICKKTGTYCNLGACPYEDLKEFTVVRHGRWLEGFDGSCMCSECGKVIRYTIGYYCPNCGAKMEGEHTYG